MAADFHRKFFKLRSGHIQFFPGPVQLLQHDCHTLIGFIFVKSARRVILSEILHCNQCLVVIHIEKMFKPQLKGRANKTFRYFAIETVDVHFLKGITD